MKNTKFFAASCGLIFFSCAQLHHVQIGEIDNTQKFTAIPFDIKISETGVNMEDIKNISKVFMNKDSQKKTDDLFEFIGYFQMGPKTGNPVFVKDYAKNLPQMIYEKCPSGRVTGLMSVRESRKYPVISGEIVKVTGYCLTPKTGT